MKKFKKIIKDSLKELKTLLPIFLLAVLIGVLIEIYLPSEIVSAVLSANLLIAIPLATILGLLLPIPRYATYPIAFALLLKGAGFGVIFTLVCGEIIGESIVRDFIEIKYFGWKFYSLRFILSFIFICIGGFLMEAIL